MALASSENQPFSTHLGSKQTSIGSDDEKSFGRFKGALSTSQDREILFLSEEDSEDEGKTPTQRKEDDLAFLNRFRQRNVTLANADMPTHAERTRSFVETSDSLSDAALDQRLLQADQSSVFSGSLSELSSLQQNTEVRPTTAKDQDLLHTDCNFSLPSSGDYDISREGRSVSQGQQLYTTEAEKRIEEENRRRERKLVMERLAAKNRREEENQSECESSVPTDDQITSASEKDTSAKRATERRHKKSKKVREKSTTRTLNLGPDLECLSSEDEDPRPFPVSVEKHIRPLSKKDLDEMSRVQARIEREKHITNAAVRKAPLERKRFDIHDLLAKIGSSEADRKKSLALTRSEKDELGHESRKSPSSDPIETFSDDDEVHSNPRMLPGKPRCLNLYAQIKDQFSSKALALDDNNDGDLDQPYSENLIEKAYRQSEDRERWRKWKEKKKDVLKEAITRENETVLVEDEDELEIEIKPNSTDTPERKSSVHSRTLTAHVTGHRQEERHLNNSSTLSAISFRPGEQDEPNISIDVQQNGCSSQSDRQALQSENVDLALRKSERKKSQYRGKRMVDLQAYIRQNMERQNIESRRGRISRSKIDEEDDYKAHDAEKEDLSTLIELLRENAQSTSADHQDEKMSQDGDVEDLDYTPEDTDVGHEMDNTYGSASESEAADSHEDESEAAGPHEDEKQAKLHLCTSIPGSDEEDQDDFLIRPKNTQKSKQRKQVRMISDEDEDDDNSKMSEAKANFQLLLGDDDKPTLTEKHLSSKDLGCDRGHDEKDGNMAMPSSLFAVNHEGKDASPNPSSIFGQFFEDTQSNVPLQNDNFKVLSTNEKDGSGFTQFFEEGTPLSKSLTGNDLMPPPPTSARRTRLDETSDQDEFAALRKAQASQARLIDDEPFDLPALDDILLPEQQDENLALELKAMQAEEEERLHRLKSNNRFENGVTYINKEGFFTQTRPQSYSFQLSQMHSQLENHIISHGQTDLTKSSHADKGASEEDKDDVDLDLRSKRRFRRVVHTQDESNPIQDEMHSIYPAKSGRTMHRTAFDVLKEGSRTSTRKEEDKTRKRFIQGEAEESDGNSESEDGVAAKRGNGKGRHGGLEGVFSDQDDQGSIEEDEEEEEDGEDLEGLIDEQEDEDEAEKDVLARERYLKDVDEDERAALALHERAVRGAFRNKRRSRNHQSGTLEGFLEDDYEDDWLQKLAKNPYGSIAKKRRLEGKDGMDALAEKEDSQAFVREYHETHRDSQSFDEYSFLMNGEEDESDNDNLNESQTDAENAGMQSAYVSRREIQDAIAEKRKAKRNEIRRLHALDDDEAEAEDRIKQQTEEELRERQLQRKIERILYNASDEEDEVNYGDQEQTKTGFPGATLSPDQHFDSARQEEENDETVPSLATILPGITPHAHISNRERTRLAKLAKEFENEPDWKAAKEAIQRVRGRPTTKNKSESSQRWATEKATVNVFTSNPASSFNHVKSRLQGVMGREKLFS